jgi:hypothetical protein
MLLFQLHQKGDQTVEARRIPANIAKLPDLVQAGVSGWPTLLSCNVKIR